MAEPDAESKRRKLSRHSELGERDDCRPVGDDEPLDELILPAVHQCVHASEYVDARWVSFPAAGEPLDVEVDAEDGGERDEAGERRDRLMRIPPQSREEHRVDEQVALRV